MKYLKLLSVLSFFLLVQVGIASDIESAAASSVVGPACAVCKKNEKVFLCSRCHSVRYCSRDCQAAHWKEHKSVCLAKKVISKADIENKASPVSDSSGSSSASAPSIPSNVSSNKVVATLSSETTPIEKRGMTGELRYPQLYRSISREFQDDSRERLNVLVLGPGLSVMDSIPQLHELSAYFSRDRITVVDLNPAVLAAIPNSQYQVMFAESILNQEQNFGNENAVYQALLGSLITKANKSLPKTIVTHQMAFESLTFPENSFDVIVATYSLVYALSGKHLDKEREILANVLRLVKRDGIMYVDSQVTGEIRHFFGIQGPEGSFRFSVGGLQFEANHLPHPTAIIRNVGGRTFKFMLSEYQQTATFDLYAIKRVR